MTEKKPLTRKQKAILDWIRDVIGQNEVSPTVQEIANEFSISLGNASRYVTDLCAKGHLKKDPKKRFSIEVLK